MKKMILTMVALLSMTVMTAQTTNNESSKNQRPAMSAKRMSHEDMTTQMATKLNLSDEQKTKVAALNKEYQDVLMPQAPQRNNSQQRGGKGKARKDINVKNSVNGQSTNQQKPEFKKEGNSENQAKRQEYETKLKEILSDDQYTNYQKMGPQGNRKAKKFGKAQNNMKQETTNQ